MSVLVFDSGLGGLSILRELRTVLPTSSITYLADNAAFPYGDWEQEKLRLHIRTVMDDAVSHFQPSGVVIACNTASTLALEELRAAHDIPFVGTVPAIKPACEHTASGQISVLATPGTVNRPYTTRLIAEFGEGIEVTLVGAGNLALMAEKYLITGLIDETQLRTEIAPCFVERNGARTDVIVLACTHYPFLINAMRKVAPWPVDWLDPAEAIARQAGRVMKDITCQKREADDKIVFTAKNASDETLRLAKGFGLSHQ